MLNACSRAVVHVVERVMVRDPTLTLALSLKGEGISFGGGEYSGGARGPPHP